MSDGLRANGSIRQPLRATSRRKIPAFFTANRVDILVNNVGILRDKSLAKMNSEDFRLFVAVHLMGVAICIKAVRELVRANRVDAGSSVMR